jgi:eukaryotic-like serine/threonine-protein kinase
MLEQPLLGRTLGGRYEVVRNLSGGGFGHTYIVEDGQRPGRPRCVLKHLSFASQNPALLEQARRMFQHEAEVLETLGRHDRIPRLLAYFEEVGEFYLVQEWIEGPALSDEIQSGQQLSTPEVVGILADVLEILQFVHGQGVIHRDLKPENLIRRQSDGKLVLIDFGAVKTMDVLSTTMPDRAEREMSVPVYTTGYAASEQCLGQPRFASDLYALGMIAVQAITGTHPTQLAVDPDTGSPVWGDGIEARLDRILHKLTAFHFGQRYQSAIEVQRAIQEGYEQAGTTLMPLETVPQAPIKAVKPRWLLPIVGVGSLLIVGGLWLTRSMPGGRIGSMSNYLGMIDPAIMTRISHGDRILNGGNSQKKLVAMQMANGEFKAAVKGWTALRVSEPNDPEVLIYLHNSKIGAGKSYTIGVVVPLQSKPTFANEVLRGVAQAQDEINAGGGINGVPVRVTIGDDGNDVDLAGKIAQHFVNDETVLGVVGHGVSETTHKAAGIYQPADLAVVSPLSSAENLAEFKQHLWRAIPSDRLTAKQLTDYAVKQLHRKKIAIFYISKDQYSESLKTAFKDALDYGHSQKIATEIDINQPDFDAGEQLNSLKLKGVDAIFLATNHHRLKDAMAIIQANDRLLPLLAGETFYSDQVLNTGKGDVVGMVLAVPAQQSDLRGSLFAGAAEKLWGTPVEWRSALGYDATVAMLAGMKKSQPEPSRAGIRSVLADPKFKVNGATQAVQFEETGDRLGAVRLLQVVRGEKSQVPTFRPMRR